jgi:N-acetylneuraminate synthase
LKEICIGAKKLGRDEPPFIVAELSANHAGSMDKVRSMIAAAAASGVDAIKLQTYTADTITLDSDRPEFQITKGPRAGMSLYELYQKASTPWEWHQEIFSIARESGLEVFSSPFDLTAVDFLESLEVPAYKIASFELVDIPLIRRVARTGKPVIMSTGMATLADIQGAIGACYAEGNHQVIVLHCVSGYPTPVEEMNLQNIPYMAEQFDCLVGLSDHTLSVDVAISSVALGACFIEKHFTLNRADNDLDSAFSLEPLEFQHLVTSSKAVWSAMGRKGFIAKESESYTKRLRRSLYVVKDIDEGDVFTSENVRSVRPCNGLPPKFYDQVIGAECMRKVQKNTPLSSDMIKGFDC